MDLPSDEDLMARIARGDAAAFRLLTERYVPKALGLARRMLRNDADAEDVVQEACLRVWINAPRWRPIASFRTWFYRIVLNLCLNQRRRKHPLPLENAGDPVDPAPSADIQLERDEVGRALATAIADLPERQRAAIVLSYQQGLSNAETAAILNSSVSGVETLLVRAKRALRTQLGTGIADE